MPDISERSFETAIENARLAFDHVVTDDLGFAAFFMTMEKVGKGTPTKGKTRADGSKVMRFKVLLRHINAAHQAARLVACFGPA